MRGFITGVKSIGLLVVGGLICLTGGEPELRELPDKEWIIEQYDPVVPGDSREMMDPYRVPDRYLQLPAVSEWLEKHKYQDLFYNYLLADGGGIAPREFIVRVLHENKERFDGFLHMVPFTDEDRSLLEGFRPHLQQEWELRNAMDDQTGSIYGYSVFFYQHYRDYLRGKRPNWVDFLKDNPDKRANAPLIYSPIQLANSSGDDLFELDLTKEDWQVIRNELKAFVPEAQNAFYRKLLDEDDIVDEPYFSLIFPFVDTQAFHRLPPSMRLFYLDLIYLSYRWENGHILLGEELQAKLQAQREAERPDFSKPLEHELGWYLRDGWPVPPITRVVEAMDNGLVDFSDSRAMAVGLAAIWESYAHLIRPGPEVALDQATIPSARFLLAAMADQKLPTPWRFRAEIMANEIRQKLGSWWHRDWPNHRPVEAKKMYNDLQSYLPPINDDSVAGHRPYILELRFSREASVSAAIELINMRIELLDDPQSIINDDPTKYFCAVPFPSELTSGGYHGEPAVFSLTELNDDGMYTPSYLRERLTSTGSALIIKRVTTDLNRWGEQLAQDQTGRQHLRKWLKAYPELQEVIAGILEDDDNKD